MAEPFKISPGTLYLVSTPIGNLRDITLRALDVLEQVDLVAAEDTRTSRILLDHYGLQAKLTSYHDFNKERVTAGLIRQLQNGMSLALVTDAGTPGISDPAFYLVREAIKNDLPVEAIPGATAFVPALVISGMPTDRFCFEGFLPPKKGRQIRLQELAQESRTMIFYESPKRVQRTLQDLYQAFGDREVVLVRELTKKFEQVVRGKLSEIIFGQMQFNPKGEFVLVVHGKEKRKQKKNKYEKTGNHGTDT